MTNTPLEDIHTDPRLLFELASGVARLDDIADRYSLDLSFLRELMENPRVKKVILEKRKELDETGYTLAQKAKLCFEDLLPEVYKKARAEGASLGATLAAAEFFRKVAGLDKQEINLTSDKFSITINIAPSSREEVAKVTSMVVDVTDKNDKPPLFSVIPAFIMPGASDVNGELAYPESSDE